MIHVIGDMTPSFPEDFNRRLQAFDKDLLVVWHMPPLAGSRPGRWKIEQCTEHNGSFRINGNPEHNHLCRRVYVMMVQDEEGTPMPLGDHVFTKLREMRENVERLGGATERGLKNYVQESNNIDVALEGKREEARKDIMDHNQKFNRTTFNRLGMVLDHLQTAPNK